MSQSTGVKKNSFSTYLKLTWEMSKFSVLSEMEYRVTFWMKVIGIIVNDIFHIFIWVIFFQRFPTVNGWHMHDMILLFSVFLFMTALFSFFAAGTMFMARKIVEGKIDYYLSLPKNPLWYMSVDRTELWSIGDGSLGLFLFFWFGQPNFERTILFFVGALLAALILTFMNIFIQSLAFYFGNFEETADRWFWTIFGFGFYPQNAFSGGLKFLTLTLFPAFFLYFMPVSAIRDLNWAYIVYESVFCACIFVISVSTFKYGLKRYESGNLINVRV